MPYSNKQRIRDFIEDLEDAVANCQGPDGTPLVYEKLVREPEDRI